MKSKGVWSHLDGSAIRPQPPTLTTAIPGAAGTVPPVQGPATAAGVPPQIPVNPAVAEYEAALEEWEKSESLALDLLTQRIPDSTVIRTASLPSAAAMWAEIVREYTEKGTMTQTDLRTKFLESKCPDKGDVRAFLDSLRVKREELAQAGVHIDEKDYRSTIVKSLPWHLSNFASNQLTSARLFSPTQTIHPDVLISVITEEYDRNQRERERSRQARAPNGKARDNDEAMAVTPSYSGRRGNSNSRPSRKEPECWNCGETGHLRRDCKKPKKKSSSGRSESANQAIEDSDDEAFGVSDIESVADSMPALMSVSDSDESESMTESMPSLRSVSDSSDEEGEGSESDDESEDWFSDVGEDLNTPWGDGYATDELSGINSEGSSYVDVDLESVGEKSSGSVSSYDSPVLVSTTAIEEIAAVVDNGAIGTSEIRTELYDSGTTRHISPYRDMFNNYVDTPPKSLNAANKRKFVAVGKGDMVIEVPNGVDASRLQLTEVLYSPEVGYTLVSIGRLDECGYATTFGDGKCTIRDENGDTIGQIPKSAKAVYKVVHDDDEPANATEETVTWTELHRRMGHISSGVAKKLAENGLVTGVRVDMSSGEPVFCESCVYAKATRKPVAKEREGERATEFGGEIHSDLWGPAPVTTIKGRRYYVSFTDDKTRLTDLYLLKHKSDTFRAYKEYEASCKTQHKADIRILHSDRGGEYTGKEFVVHLKRKGTKQKLTVHDTPQHNGVAERLNRTILEKVRAMLHASGQPRMLWGEAAHHAVWLKNRTPTKALNSGATPYEAAYGKKPDLRGVREWGSRCWVRNESSAKLGGRVAEGVWVGIDDKSKGSRVFWPGKRRVTVERNVYFDESSATADHLEGEDLVIIEAPTAPSTSSNQVSTSIPTAPEPATTTSSNLPDNPEHRIQGPVPPDDAPEDVPRPSRARKPSQRVQDLIRGIGVTSNRRSDPRLARGVQAPTMPPVAEPSEFEGEGVSEQMMAVLEDELMDLDEELAMLVETAEAEALEPSSLADAKRRPDWADWERALDEELATLHEAGTWEIVEPPPGANIVGSKWVFKAKKDADGNIARKKARLVAQGFSQVPGIDYFDTYAPVARLASIRTVLALAAREGMELHQVDIKGAYLNGELTEDEVIYMRQPPGYASRDHPTSYVCRLRKTLYGLKQSGRRWYQKLVQILVDSLGFTRCEVDQAVFFKREGNSDLTIVVVHVDDCTIAASALSLVMDLKARLREHVEITDLGELHWLLGIEVKREKEKRTISLSQRSYIESIIRRFGFEDSKPISTPMDPNTKISTAQSPSTGPQYATMRNIPYREAVGALMYAMLGTRPDISFAVTTVSKFSSNPGMAHWEAVKRIYRYLLGTKELWLSYGGVAKELVGYADADGSMSEDRRATSGYAFLVDGGAVSWSTKRQEIVSLSTTESEYIAATHASKEALWLRSLISQVFGPFPLDTATTLFSDNQSAIALSKDHQYHARTKHIDVRFHFIRWVVEDGKIRLIYCPTNDMVADTLTKALPSPKVKHFAVELGLRDA